MKKFLTMILVAILMTPSVLCASGTMNADTVAEVYAKQLSNEQVEVVWSWDKIVPQATFIDFETGDFSQGNFVNDPTYPWEITQDAYEGNYAVRSTNKGVDGGEYFLNLEVDVPYDAVMSFYHKVSSEWSFDGGVFYIDGQSKASMTGTDKDWEYVEVAVSAGKHTYTWGYFKDGEFAEGEDTYWVDNIVPFAPREEIAEGWLHYDNGVLLNAAGMGSVGADNYWAVSFPDMSQYAGQTLTKIAMMLHNGTNVKASVCLGGTDAPGTVMATQDFAASPGEIVEIELDTPVAIDGTEPLWIVMYCNDGEHPAAASEYCGDPNGSWFGYNDVWKPAHEWNLSPMTWILRAYVEDATGRTVALSQGDFECVDTNTANVSLKSVSSEKRIIVGTPSRATRSEHTFNLYKKNIFTDTEAELIAEGLDDMEFVDDTWATAEAGLYQWGVEVADVNSGKADRAAIVWSNTLDKNMFTTVEVQVELNTDESTNNTEVTLLNVNEPEYIYNVILDATGTYKWDKFRKGTYKYTVHKEGYESNATEKIVEILDDTTLTCTLLETITAANNLYVSPTGWAMWEGEKVVSKGDEFVFDFEDATMDGWVTYDVDGDDFTWKHVDTFWGLNYGYNSNGSILSASYTNELGPLHPDNYIVTEKKYLIGGASQLTFMVSPYDEVFPHEHYGVAVSTTGNTPEDMEMIWEETLLADKGNTRNVDAVRGQNNNRINNWYLRTIDLSAFEGQEIYIALRHFDSYDEYIFFIDDISLINATKSSRAIQSYTVLLNGDEEATVTEMSYQHANVTPGETYTTTVIANFASGESAPIESTWTCVACDEFEGASDLKAEYLNGNMVLTWTLPTDALGVLIYRDDELLTEKIVETENYYDPVEADVLHKYCIRVVHDNYAVACPQCFDHVGMSENSTNTMSIYPNPVRDNLTITAENMTRITIVNTLGQVVYDRNVNSDNEIVNMSSYDSGIYMLRITTEKGVTTNRISVIK